MLSRLLVPLLIPRRPLVIIVALVLDAVLDSRAMLLVFPNTFELLFIVSAVIAAFVLGFPAVFQFVARPRMGAPDWRWRFAADSLPQPLTEAPARHAHRLRAGACSGRAGREGHAAGAALDRVVGAQRASERRLLRCRLCRAARGRPGLDLPDQPHVLGRRGLPVGTALFFAFLITLPLWLYDGYKPVYDARFAASPLRVTPARDLWRRD